MSVECILTTNITHKMEKNTHFSHAKVVLIQIQKNIEESKINIEEH